MSEFKIHKCPSCGSTQIETLNLTISTCSHCGSTLSLKNNKYSQLLQSSLRIKALLFSIIALIIISVVAVIWFLPKEMPQALPVQTNPVVINVPKIQINNSISGLPKISKKTQKFTNESVKKAKAKQLKPTMAIVGQKSGITVIGGLFWIIKIRNDSDATVFNAGAVMSLFDLKNQRIDEQKGWAKKSHLTAGEETEVLILISDPPRVEYTQQLISMARFSNAFDQFQEEIEVLNFIIKPKPNNAKNMSIIGDVINRHAYAVDFIRVIAIAKDINGDSIGLADAYVTTANLQPQQQSGFKISAGTFLTQPAATWTLWAAGRKHRD